MTDIKAERIEQQQKEFTKLFKPLQELLHEIDGPHFSIAFELKELQLLEVASGSINPQETRLEAVSIPWSPIWGH